MTNSDLDIMARTIFGEARGEDFDGKLAVAHVILNRVKKRHRKEVTIAGVCTEPYQFSCWLPDDPNRLKMETISVNQPVFRDCLMAALKAIAQGDDEDMTLGSTHYHTTVISPAWAEGKDPVVTIGNHAFYNNVD